MPSTSRPAPRRSRGKGTGVPKRKTGGTSRLGDDRLGAALTALRDAMPASDAPEQMLEIAETLQQRLDALDEDAVPGEAPSRR